MNKFETKITISRDLFEHGNIIEMHLLNKTAFEKTKQGQLLRQMTADKQIKLIGTGVYYTPTDVNLVFTHEILDRQVLLLATLRGSLL